MVQKHMKNIELSSETRRYICREFARAERSAWLGVFTIGMLLIACICACISILEFQSAGFGVGFLVFTVFACVITGLFFWQFFRSENRAVVKAVRNGDYQCHVGRLTGVVDKPINYYPYTTAELVRVGNDCIAPLDGDAFVSSKIGDKVLIVHNEHFEYCLPFRKR